MAIRTFNYFGSEELFVVPVGVTSLIATVIGASGGTEDGPTPVAGGLGGYIQATLTVTPGETLRIRVGKKGGDASVGRAAAAAFYGGAVGGEGTSNAGGGGGGESDIRRGGTADSFRVLVAAGAGGGGTQAVGLNGGQTLDTEAATANAATAGVAGQLNGGGGGGAGWRGGAGGTGPAAPAQGGTNMAHSTQTSSVTSISGYQTGDGFVQLIYSTPSTIAQRFFHATNEQDFTAAGEVDIRKLLEAAPGTNSTTICTHANAAGTTDITLDPYTNSSTASDIRANCGWAINRNGSDGMNSIDAAKRIILAGTWTFVTFVSIPAAGTLTGTLTVSNIYNVYRVSSTGARTSLFTCTSNTVASGLLADANSGALTATSSQPLITLEADETIHVGIISHMVQVAGTLGATVSGVATYRVGTAAEYVEVPSPGVRTGFSNETVVAGKGTAARGALAITASRSMVGRGTITGSKVVLSAKSSSLVGVGTVTRGILGIAASRTLVGKGVVTGTKAVIAAKSFTLVGKGIVAESAKAITMARSAVGKGTVTGTKVTVAARSYTLTGIGTITGTHPVQAFRTFNLVGVGTITGRIELPIDEVPDGGGGGGTTVIPVFNNYE